MTGFRKARYSPRVERFFRRESPRNFSEAQTVWVFVRDNCLQSFRGRSYATGSRAEPPFSLEPWSLPLSFPTIGVSLVLVPLRRPRAVRRRVLLHRPLENTAPRSRRVSYRTVVQKYNRRKSVRSRRGADVGFHARHEKLLRRDSSRETTLQPRCKSATAVAVSRARTTESSFVFFPFLFRRIRDRENFLAG